jgi:signal transduction histidine kinase/HAMP domain-containing protein
MLSMLSIRLKIFGVIALVMVVALAISAQALLNALHFDVQVEATLSKSLQSSRAIRNAQDALRDVRAREDQLLSDWRDAEEVQLEPSLRQFLEQLHWGPLDDGQAAFRRQIEGIRDAVASYREMWALWSQQLQGMQLAWRSGGATLREQGLALQRRLDDLRAALRVSALPSMTPTPNADALTLNLRAAAMLEQAMAEAAFWNSFALPEQHQLSLQLPALVEQAEQRLAMLRVKLDHLRQLIPTTRPELDALMSALDETFSELSVRVDTLISAHATHTSGLNQRAARLRSARDRIELALAALAQAHQQQIEAEQRTLSSLRTRALTIMGMTLAIGFLIVIAIGLLMTRTISRNFKQLVSAARDIQRGNLDARVSIRSQDELTELGQAFNAMARYLKERRHRQSDYNDIVSLLNSTLNLQELLDLSLRETVERTGSALAAVYLSDPGGQALHLGHAFGLSPPEPLTFALGEGLVGQVAQQRRKLLIHRDAPPSPSAALPTHTLPHIHMGVAALAPRSVLLIPLIHLDQLLGVLSIASLQHYDEATADFIEEIALQVSVALNNARFVQTIEATAATLQERTEELSAQRARLETVNKELADANRLQSDFLANVTHELRTPLNSIIGFTELVLDRPDLDPKATRNLQTVLRNATGLLGLINDLLDITKIEAGRATMNIARFDLGELIEDCLQTVSPMIAHHAITLEARLPNTPVTIWNDRTKLKQILLNLLSNAAKFTEEGAIRVDVRDLDARWVEVAVIDSGIGIHADDLPFIFDKFRQVDGSISRKYSGTGLGLAITSELIRLLGGAISAKSEVGAGSTFIITLPINLLDPQALASTSALPSPPPPSATPIALSHGKVSAAGVPAPSLPLTASASAAVSSVSSAGLPPALAALPQRSSPGLPPAAAELHPPQRLTLMVIDEHPDTVIHLRKHMRNDSFDIQSAFICEDALFNVEQLQPSRPVVLLLGQPLPEDHLDDTLRALSTQLQRRLAYSVCLANTPLRDAMQRLDLPLTCLGELERPLAPSALLALLREHGLLSPAPHLDPSALTST